MAQEPVRATTTTPALVRDTNVPVRYYQVVPEPGQPCPTCGRRVPKKRRKRD